MSVRLGSGLTVSFATSADEAGSLTAEIDRRADGLNKGVTNFRVGDSPGFLVYTPAGMSLTEVRATLGGISSMGVAIIPVEEWLTFENSREARTSKPVSSGMTISTTYGDSLDGVTTRGSGLLAPKPLVSVVRVQYNTRALMYRLTGVGLAVPVVVFIRGVST